MTDKEKDINNTTIVLNFPNKKEDTENSSAINDGQTELQKIRSVVTSALKIITISSIVEDSISEDFFSNYENYKAIIERLRSLSLVDGNIKSDEISFLKNPIDCWMKVLSVLFVTLYSIPGNSDITCDIITSSDMKDGNMKKFSGIGMYFSTSVKLDSYDWKVHKIDFFIPNENGKRMIFIIDEEPVLYSIV